VPAGRSLAHYVDRYWTWEGRPDQLPVLMPGTGAELMIHHGRPLVADTAVGPRQLPMMHLLSLRRIRWPLTAPGLVAFTAVRFRAGGLAKFTRVPAEELVDQVVPGWAVFGGAADMLSRTVQPELPLVERAINIETVLTSLLRTEPDRRIDVAARRVYEDPSTVRVDQLGPDLGMSARHLRRGFIATVGVGPKEFQRLARFQRVVRTLLLSAPQTQLPVALSAGYYDQSHYIKEFRRLAGRRPTQLLDGTMTHFYYPSIRNVRHAFAHDRSVRIAEGEARVHR
jgi:AraC-like DNA-binding protein